MFPILIVRIETTTKGIEMTLQMHNGSWTVFSGTQAVMSFPNKDAAVEMMAYVQAKMAAKARANLADRLWSAMTP